MLERFERLRDDHAIDKGEALFLYGLVHMLRPEVVVETGTHKGLSACYIAQALKELDWGHLYTYDIVDFRAEAEFRRFELDKHVTFRKKDAREVQEKNIDFAFVDSDHSKDFVVVETRNIISRMKPGGVILFDNCSELNERKWGFTVNAAIEELGLKTLLLPNENGFRLWVK